MSFSSWLCQFSCLFPQAQVKSRVATGEQHEDSGEDLGESPWSLAHLYVRPATQRALAGHLEQGEAVDVRNGQGRHKPHLLRTCGLLVWPHPTLAST